MDNFLSRRLYDLFYSLFSFFIEKNIFIHIMALPAGWKLDKKF